MTGASPPPSELAVLQVLWERSRATAREVREILATRGRRLAHSTIVTLIKRLERRGLVGREKAKKGKAFVFRPARRPQGVRRRLVRQLVERVFGGDAIPLFSCLIEEASLSREEIKKLRRMVEALDKGAPKEDPQ
jgi:predicted transcriptional regulator